MTRLDPMTLLAALRLSDGRRWGDVAADWQVEDARAVLAEEGPRWHFLTRPRGGSKSTDLAAVLVVWLAAVAPAGARGFLAAADADQAGLVLDAARGFVQRTPELQVLLQCEAQRVVAVRSGASAQVLAADGPSAWGLLPHVVIADEVAQWPSTRNAREFWTALLSSLGKQPGARLVCLTSAGEPSHWSARVRDQAARSPRWRLAERPGPLPWVDEGFLAEQRELLMPSVYARLHLNQWVEAEDRLTAGDDLAACAVLDGPQEPQWGLRYVLSLDVGLTNDRTALAVCHRDGDAVVVDQLRTWQGSRRHPVDLQAVESAVEELAVAYNRAACRFDPSQAAQMAQRLRRRGLSVEEYVFSQASVGRLGLTLYRLLRGRLLRLPNDPALLDELAHVRLRETSPGVYRLDHDSGRHDDMAVAVALAAERLVAKPVVGPARVHVATGRMTIAAGVAVQAGGLGGPRLPAARGAPQPFKDAMLHPSYRGPVRR